MCGCYWHFLQGVISGIEAPRCRWWFKSEVARGEDAIYKDLKQLGFLCIWED